MTQDHSNSVTVAGAVKVGGRFSLNQGIVGVLDAIAAAGGVERAPWHYDVVLRRKRLVVRQRLSDLLNGRDFALEPADHLTVLFEPKKFIAFGSVNAPAPFEFTSAQPSLMDAIAMTSGLSERTADRRGVYVFRPSKQQEHLPILFQLNMNALDAVFVADAFAIQPNDVIYVTAAPVTDFNNILLPILRALSLIQNLQRLDNL